MKDNKLEILVVEDAPENLAVAKEYFNSQNNLSVDYATNFQEISNLERYDGVLSDLMFPYDNRGNMEQHKILVSKIMKTLKENSNLNLEDDEVRKDLEVFEKTLNSPLGKVSSGNSKEIYVEPMGILVAEECKKEGIPYIIITSGHGTHGDITTPVVKYMEQKKLIEGFLDLASSGANRYKEKYFHAFPPKEEYKKHLIENCGWSEKEFEERRWLELTKGNFIRDAIKTNPNIWEYAHGVLTGKINKEF